MWERWEDMGRYGEVWGDTGAEHLLRALGHQVADEADEADELRRDREVEQRLQQRRSREVIGGRGRSWEKWEIVKSSSACSSGGSSATSISSSRKET